VKKVRKTPAAKQLVTKPHLRSWRRKVASYNRAAKKEWKAALSAMKKAWKAEADDDVVDTSDEGFLAQAAKRAHGVLRTAKSLPDVDLGPGKGLDHKTV